MKSFLKSVFKHKAYATSALAIIVCLCIILTVVILKKPKDAAKNEAVTAETTISSSNSSQNVSEVISSEEISSVSSEETPASSEVNSVISSEEVSSVSSENQISSEKTNPSKEFTSSPKSDSSKKTSTKKTTATSNGGYQYNTNLDIEDNVFMDALIYTGYNMKKHRADGKMWQYILAKYKRGYGWLSDITYAGGSSGLETKNGKPDIKAFERGGLVCASFATYVYFNYLPNVAGIDTSSLPRPEKTTLADSWYKAAQKWIEKGYSRSIDFTATVDPSTRYINFNPKEEIPIGSIIIFRTYESRNSSNKVGSHVVVYAGHKNGFHWVYHVGTKNGPEMCAVERMLYGPEAQWPMLVVSTPSNIRMAAMLEVELKDDSGKPISGVEFSLKSKETGKTMSLGKTNKSGIISKECLNYGEYTLIQKSVPKGYTAKVTEKKVKLTTKNNSQNKTKVINIKDKPIVTSAPASTQKSSSEIDVHTSSEISSHQENDNDTNSSK